MPESKRLLIATDNGNPITVPVESFAPPQRSGGWGPYAETFLRFNIESLRALDVRPEVTSDISGMQLKLIPGGRTGSVPLRSGLTKQVTGGLIVKPRFGWVGVGQILHETGWHTAPEFLDLPMVPGSSREVPPWVLAGPVLARLETLLCSLTPGYRQREEVVLKPRGRIIWKKYIDHSLVRGLWHHLPCRFPDLDTDPLLRRHIRWALERIQRNLLLVGGNDPVALSLATITIRLIDLLADVTPLMPRREELDRRVAGNRVLGEALRRGIEAISWIVDERGLGGGNERDGLAWVLPLEKLWESYVESVYRREVADLGGEVRVGRLGETVFPLNWSDSTHRTLGHLAPDLVIKRVRSVQVVDAKYKSHLAEMDEIGWRRFGDEVREAHRADLHQILAYASLYEAEEVTATLVYPLRQSTYNALRQRHHENSFADLFHGGRRIRLELRGMPFGVKYRNQEY
jgi:5-methylcytosine-specific restriction endonuclease McrBC regulatory subunit McrC